MEKDIKELLKTYDDLEEQYKLLLKRVNKAIDFIKNNIVATETEEILLNILRGKDNEL